MPPMTWPAIEPISTERLRLEPVSVAHAAEMVEVLADTTLYEFTGGEPPTLEALATRYSAQARGGPADGSAGWLNWMLRRRDTGELIGFVQATLERGVHGESGEAGEHGDQAQIAWVVNPAHQRLGFAKEAAGAMVEWLRASDVVCLVAFIRPDHAASMRVARSQGMGPTSIHLDGETKWVSSFGER